MKFDSQFAAGSDLNEGTVVAGRVDFHPRGPMTYFDSDPHTPTFKTTWSLAGYAWHNDGSNNRFTTAGIALDPTRADLDSASGLEVSGGLRGRGVTLDWQLNLIRGETVAESFNGGGIIRGAPTPRIDRLADEGLRLTNFNVDTSGSRALARRSKATHSCSPPPSPFRAFHCSDTRSSPRNHHPHRRFSW